MSGDYPGNARKRRAALKVEPLKQETVAALVEANGDAADPGGPAPAGAACSLEPRCVAAHLARRGALRNHDEMGHRYLRRLWGAFSGRLPVPDARARLQAIETVLAQGPYARRSLRPRSDRIPRAGTMSWCLPNSGPGTFAAARDPTPAFGGLKRQRRWAQPP